MPIPTQARQYVVPKFDGIQNLTLKTAPVPKPKGGEVLVKIHAVSLNFRDIMIVHGQYISAIPENIVPVSDMAGEIVALGEAVKPEQWKIGDRVSANFTQDHIFGDLTPEAQKTGLGGGIDGVLTEYQTFPTYSLVKIPEHLSYEEASTLPGAAVTAYNALNGPTPLKAGDYVLVQGTGGVSVFALQLAVASGATVIATSSSDDKLRFSKKLGAKYLINYKKNPNWDEEVLKITNGQGVHHIVEVGGPGNLNKSLNCVRMAGWIHMIGFLAGEADDLSLLPLNTLKKACIIRGILIGSRSQFEDMNRLITGQNIKPIVDKVFAFEDAQEAYRYLQAQKHVGKVVIRVASP